MSKTKSKKFGNRNLVEESSSSMSDNLDFDKEDEVLSDEEVYYDQSH